MPLDNFVQACVVCLVREKVSQGRHAHTLIVHVICVSVVLFNSFLQDLQAPLRYQSKRTVVLSSRRFRKKSCVGLVFVKVSLQFGQIESGPFTHEAGGM